MKLNGHILMPQQEKSGLDINLGTLCSTDAFNWAKSTFPNREGRAGATALPVDGAFSNLLVFGNQRIGIASDGIGTKIELAERTQIYDTLGYDLVAMVADDLVAMGFEPTNISNIIDVNYCRQSTINALMKGLAAACNFSGMSISGGEIAELGDRIGGYGAGMHFNWCSTAIGILPNELSQPIDGTKVKAGQVVIALKSRGFRSNGFSLLRRKMESHFGIDWHTTAYDETTTWGEKLLTPSLIYTPLIVEIIKQGIQLSGIAHITGGGIFDNFQRILKTKQLGVNLDNLFPALEVMSKIIELAAIPIQDAYLYWNMGNGMLMVVDESDQDSVLAVAKQFNYAARAAGRITADKKMTLHCETVHLEKTY